MCLTVSASLKTSNTEKETNIMLLDNLEIEDAEIMSIIILPYTASGGQTTSRSPAIARTGTLLLWS